MVLKLENTSSVPTFAWTCVMFLNLFNGFSPKHVSFSHPSIPSVDAPLLTGWLSQREASKVPIEAIQAMINLGWVQGCWMEIRLEGDHRYYYCLGLTQDFSNSS